MSAKKGTIVREQFTAFDERHRPDCDNADYLEYVRVSTGLSSEIISYGYKEKINEGEGWSEWRWVKRNYAYKKMVRK
jgi:hypothetical protein